MQVSAGIWCCSGVNSVKRRDQLAGTDLASCNRADGGAVDQQRRLQAWLPQAPPRQPRVLVELHGLCRAAPRRRWQGLQQVAKEQRSRSGHRPSFAVSTPLLPQYASLTCSAPGSIEKMTPASRQLTPVTSTDARRKGAAQLPWGAALCLSTALYRGCAPHLPLQPVRSAR